MNNWIPKNKIVNSSVAILLVSIGLYFVGLLIISQKTIEIKDSYRNTESESFKEEKQLALKSASLSNTEDIQTLRSFFIQKGDEVEFIKQIENIGRKAGIKFEIDSIDLKTETSDSFKEDVMIKLSINGSWESVVSFLDMLEKMPFGVSVENLNLNTDMSGSWSGTLHLILFREK